VAFGPVMVADTKVRPIADSLNPSSSKAKA
jgi:hypothetical protein